MIFIANWYFFTPGVDVNDVEEALDLAITAAEILHETSHVQLCETSVFNAEKRTCAISSNTPFDKDVNRLFVGFLCREYGAGSIQVCRVEFNFRPEA
jgi:hypothetical protein